MIMNMNTIMVTFLDACMHTHIQYTYTVYTFINSKFLHKFLGPVEIYFIPLTTTTTTCFDLIWFHTWFDLLPAWCDLHFISYYWNGMKWNGILLSHCRVVSYCVVPCRAVPNHQSQSSKSRSRSIHPWIKVSHL